MMRRMKRKRRGMTPFVCIFPKAKPSEALPMESTLSSPAKSASRHLDLCHFLPILFSMMTEVIGKILKCTFFSLLTAKIKKVILHYCKMLKERHLK